MTTTPECTNTEQLRQRMLSQIPTIENNYNVSIEHHAKHSILRVESKDRAPIRYKKPMKLGMRFHDIIPAVDLFAENEW